MFMDIYITEYENRRIIEYREVLNDFERKFRENKIVPVSKNTTCRDVLTSDLDLMRGYCTIASQLDHKKRFIIVHCRKDLKDGYFKTIEKYFPEWAKITLLIDNDPFILVGIMVKLYWVHLYTLLLRDQIDIPDIKSFFRTFKAIHWDHYYEEYTAFLYWIKLTRVSLQHYELDSGLIDSRLGPHNHMSVLFKLIGEEEDNLKNKFDKFLEFYSTI